MHPPLPLNDVHSRLNPTAVAEVIGPRSVVEVVAAVRRARAAGLAISISGACHAMGGQQFGAACLHLDMRGMNRLLSVDHETGLARMEAGITWKALLTALETAQSSSAGMAWTFVQKQTGADDLTIGGAVASNIHGRGLAWRPFIQDVESLVLVDAAGSVRRISRALDPERFRLVVGGYGLFGIVVEVELRLRPRQHLQRMVEITSLAGLARRIHDRVQEGYVMGDFQFCPDRASPTFLNEGVFACYRPAPGPSLSAATTLNPSAWRRLMMLAHSDMPSAWQAYADHYRSTHGQIYLSDHAQMSHYDPSYEEHLQETLPGLPPGSLMISELYVPRDRLEDFMRACADDLRRHHTTVIYGTIRFIEQDAESFLPWARQDYACIVLNLRVTHTPQGLDSARAAFRLLMDRALERGGSFYLTYHRWATRQQLLTAHPRLPEFLRLKRQHDPDGLFQSEWYRHTCRLLEGDVEA